MKPSLFFSYSLITALFLTSANAQTGWQWQNPMPQGNDLNDVWVLDRTTIIAVGDRGTLLRSTDAGLTWAVTHMLAGTPEDIVDLQFNNEEKGWALANRYRPADWMRESDASSSILQTADGGASWSTIATFEGIRLNDLCFMDGSIGWALGYVPARTTSDTLLGILFKTSDGGITWDTAFVRSTPGQDAYPEVRSPYSSIQFIDERQGWMVGGSSTNAPYGDLLKTTDGGVSWNVIYDSLCHVSQIQFTDSSHGWLVHTWSAWVWAHSVARTMDGGVTWEAVFSRTSWSDPLSTPSVFFINDSVGWVVTQNNLHRSKDGGLSWLVDTLECPFNSAVHFLDELNGCVTGACGQIMSTTDGGLSWIRTTRSLMSENLTSIDFVDEWTGWVVGDHSHYTLEAPDVHGKMYKTTDGGSSWFEEFQVSWGGSVGFTDVDAVSPQVIYASAGDVHKTTDGGTTWSHLDATYDLGIRTLSFLDENIGYAGGRADHGRVYKTTNGGVTWAGVLSVIGSIESVFFLNPSVGWAVGWYNQVYRTTDGGLSWQATGTVWPGPSDLALNSVFFTDPRNGWAVGFHECSGVIMRSSDGGESWSLAYESPEYYGTATDDFSFHSVRFTDSLCGVVVGGRGTIMCTTDGGYSWYRGFEATGRVLTNVHFVSEKVGWIVGAAGTILKTTSGGISFIDEGGKIGVPDGVALAQNFPNPFNPETVVRYQLSEVSDVRLVVYDLLGREVAVLVNEKKMAGAYEVKFDASGLASGVYFYRLQAGDFVQTRKLLVLR